MNNFFDRGTAIVGGKTLVFEKRLIRGGFLMYVPQSFSEDKSIVSTYSYWFSEDKSPLSIAIKYSPVTEHADREKMIAHYFSSSPDSRYTATQLAEDGLIYRETVTESRFLSVYSLRFSLTAGEGILFGCFNCAAAYKDDWKPVILQALQNIEPARVSQSVEA